MILRIYEEIYKRRTFTIAEIVDAIYPEYDILGRDYLRNAVKGAVARLVRDGIVRKVSSDPVVFENLNPVGDEEAELRECPVCGKKFYPKRGVQDVYCSRRCYERAKARRRRKDTRKRVKKYLHSADATAVNHGKFWSEEELLFLKEHYGKLTQKEIAKHLGRTVNAVKAKVKELGLSKKLKIQEV